MAYINGVKVNNSQLINQDLVNLYESAGVDMKTKQPTKQPTTATTHPTYLTKWH